MLEELKLESFFDSYNMQGLDLFCGQASRLRDVALKNIAVKWDSGVFVELRSLVIAEKSEYLPTEAQVRRLLEANPGLEKLDIEGLRSTERFATMFANDAVQPTSEGKPSRALMSKMQELRLFNLPFKLVETVSCNVEIPSIGYLELRSLFRGAPTSRLLGASIKHHVPHLLRLLKGGQQAKLTFGESSVSLAICTPQHESPAVQIEFKETEPMSGFDWLAESFLHADGSPSVCAAEIFQVSLEFGGAFDMAGGAFIPILDQLNAVKVKGLTIDSGCQHGEELINYLGEVRGDSQWPLPYLKSMRIGGPAKLANRLSIALQRRKQYAPAREPAAVLRPVMLDLLDIGGVRWVNKDVEKALVECVASRGSFIPAGRQLEHDIFCFGDSEDEDS